MLPQKIIHFFPFMPSRVIDPYLNNGSLESIKNVSERVDKSISVAFFILDNTMVTTQRINPSCNIQALLVLAFCRHEGLLTFLCPYSSQLGMKTKSRFITKEHHSLYAAFLKFEEFFLTSHDTLLSPHWSLEHTGAMDAAN